MILNLRQLHVLEERERDPGPHIGPPLGQIDAETFATGLASAETALGVALLCPLIPNRLAGLGLTAFGAGLLTMYFGGDQYTEDDGIRPSDAGKAIAKDSWLVGAGVALAALPRK